MSKELIEKCNVLAQRVEKLEADRDALAGISKELIERLREAAAQRVASTAMIGADDLIAAAYALEIATAGMNAYCDELGSCRKAAGFGSADDPMAQEGVGAFSDPLCVAAFVESQFKRIVAERDAQAGRAALVSYLRTISAEPTFQQRIQPWMLACFGAEIAADKAERNHRFLEEALELVQATGCSAGEAHQLVDYVYGRPVGEPVQEIGGVMVTLAALCLAHGMDMHGAAETELARIWTKVEQIRAKQAAKPKHSPLPEMVVMAQNTFPINPNGASKWAHLQKHDGAQAIGVVFRTGTGSVGSLVDGRVVWADWLAYPNGSKSADSEYTDEDMAAVGRALMSAITQYAPKGWSPADCPSEIVGDLHNECEELRSDAERYRKLRDVDAWGEDTAPGGGSAWARLGELHGSEFDAFVDSRAESAIETPAKVSPCAGHAVQQEADETTKRSSGLFKCWICLDTGFIPKAAVLPEPLDVKCPNGCKPKKGGTA